MEDTATKKRIKRKFTPEYKRSAVALTKTPGRTATDVGKSLGIAVSLLGKWCRAEEVEGKDAHRGQGNRTGS